MMWKACIMHSCGHPPSSRTCDPLCRRWHSHVVPRTICWLRGTLQSPGSAAETDVAPVPGQFVPQPPLETPCYCHDALLFCAGLVLIVSNFSSLSELSSHPLVFSH